MSQPASPPADEPLVHSEDRGRVRILTLNRPRAYNALSGAMMAALGEALETASADASVGAVVLRGAGKGFCAGHDLKELRATTEAPALQALFDACAELMQAVVTSPKPVIAAVHGVATAAGCQLVASCDLAVAARSARFATPGVGIGLFCSTPMVALSRAVPRKQALEMLLLGDMVGAEDAVGMGLVNRAVADGEELDVALALGERIAERSPCTVRLGKAAFQAQLDLPLADAYAHCSRVMTENMLTADAREGIGAFLEGREPQWSGR